MRSSEKDLGEELVAESISKELIEAIDSASEQALLNYAKLNYKEAHYALWELYGHDNRMLSCTFGIYYIFVSNEKKDVIKDVVDVIPKLTWEELRKICSWISGVKIDNLNRDQRIVRALLILMKNLKCGEDTDQDSFLFLKENAAYITNIVTLAYVRQMQKMAIVYKDEKNMFFWCSIGNQMGDVVSIFRYAVCYFEGVGCEIDFEKTKTLLETLKGKALNPEDSGILKNMEYYSAVMKEKDAEIQGWKHIREARDLIAGEPAKRDFGVITDLYKKAAEYGIKEANVELATLYLHRIDNKDGSKNEAMINMFFEAANESNAKACLALMDCYMEGIVVEKNEVAAIYCLLKAYGLEEQYKEYLDKNKISQLQSVIVKDTSIDKRVRSMLSSYMFFYGIGAKKESYDDAVKLYYDAYSPETDVFTTKVSQFHGTERRLFRYRISEELLRAGIELERGNRSFDEEKTKQSKELAKSYYKLALIECPRAAVYLLRLLFEEKNMDFLPLAKIIASEWDAKASEDAAKAVSMANYLMGMYYEFYFSQMPHTSNYSYYVMGSAYGKNTLISNLDTRAQKIDTVKECYKNAPRIDDANRRFMLIIRQ